MIKEYQGFKSNPKIITEPIVVHTKGDISGHHLVWLRHPDGKCGDIGGADGIHDVLFFIALYPDNKAYRFRSYTEHRDINLTKEELFSMAEEICPAFFEWLLWQADWF